jgi:predicted nucleotidyltransferase
MQLAHFFGFGAMERRWAARVTRVALRALTPPRATSALVSEVGGVSYRKMNPSDDQPEIRGTAPVLELVLPPPIPPRQRGLRTPPPADEIGRRLASLCRQYGITKLEVFGSVARGEALVGSDVDLIATFHEHPGLEIVTLEEACAEALGVPVHLLAAEAVEEMTNPYRRESIERDRRAVYAS